MKQSENKIMSDWYQIENHLLTVQLVSKGAEVKRLFNKIWNRELMWLGDEKIWNRSSPILFPIVGKLIDDEYIYEGKTYKIAQHGFARDMDFACTRSDVDEIEFTLNATKETFKMYPFLFELKIKYHLVENELKTVVTVKNVDKVEMLFSLGSHPAFDVKGFENYEVRFEKPEKDYYLLNNGLVDFSQSIGLNQEHITLSKKMFDGDAYIFKKLKSKHIDLVNKRFRDVIRLKNFSHQYFGIWGKENIPFICLEPWCGVADVTDHDKNLENKIGIIRLAPMQEFVFKYDIELFQLKVELE
jgi:galactose mutarotase-like enzyme